MNRSVDGQTPPTSLRSATSPSRGGKGASRRACAFTGVLAKIRGCGANSRPYRAFSKSPRSAIVRRHCRPGGGREPTLLVRGSYRHETATAGKSAVAAALSSFTAQQCERTYTGSIPPWLLPAGLSGLCRPPAEPAFQYRLVYWWQSPTDRRCWCSTPHRDCHR